MAHFSVDCPQARMVAAATSSLCEAANASVQGHASEEKLISSAKQVAASTAQLLVACKVKADQDSEAMKRLQVMVSDAGGKVLLLERVSIAKGGVSLPWHDPPGFPSASSVSVSSFILRRLHPCIPQPLPPHIHIAAGPWGLVPVSHHLPGVVWPLTSPIQETPVHFL